jgi:hypothetical protein
MANLSDEKIPQELLYPWSLLKKDQFLDNPGDPHALPPNPEKSDCNAGNQTPKHFNVTVLRGVNLPEAKEKDSDKYYLSVSTRVQEWGGKIREQDKNNKKVSKTKTIRGSQPEWNQDFPIKTLNPEACLITIKLKKSSKLGLKKSTVGSVRIYVSALEVNQVYKLQLFKNNFYPIGKACLEVEILNSS